MNKDMKRKVLGKEYLVKSILLVATLLFSLVSHATKEPVHPIELVSYEQGWLDDEGTLALKNNTAYDVQNVSFRITYLSMSGTPLDYKDFTEKVSIAPGMTKKINIPAYEHERHYSYYASEASMVNPHRFKIKFTMTDYKMAGDSSSSTPSTSASTSETDQEKSPEMPQEVAPLGLSTGDFYMLLPFLIMFPLLISFIVGLYAIVVVMAWKRDKNPIRYLVLSMVLTPLIVILLLSFVQPQPEL